MLRRTAYLVYGAIGYVAFQLAILYLIGFVGNF